MRRGIRALEDRASGATRPKPGAPDASRCPSSEGRSVQTGQATRTERSLELWTRRGVGLDEMIGRHHQDQSKPGAPDASRCPSSGRQRVRTGGTSRTERSLELWRRRGVQALEGSASGPEQPAEPSKAWNFGHRGGVRHPDIGACGPTGTNQQNRVKAGASGIIGSVRNSDIGANGPTDQPVEPSEARCFGHRRKCPKFRQRSERTDETTSGTERSPELWTRHGVRALEDSGEWTGTTSRAERRLELWASQDVSGTGRWRADQRNKTSGTERSLELRVSRMRCVGTADSGASAPPNDMT
jgi:hypothetical protein